MDERVWDDKPLKHGETITLENVTLTRKTIENSLLISGTFDVVLKKLVPSAPMVGLGEDVGKNDHAIRLGRDTILLITKKPLNLNAGWHDDGYAVSHANGKYALLEITGTGAELLLAQGTSIRFTSPSPSAMIQFGGENCILVRQSDNWLLFVEQPMLTFFCGFLADARTNV